MNDIAGFQVTPGTFKVAEFLIDCQRYYGVKRTELWIDKTNQKKWTVVLMDKRGEIMPFWKRLKAAWRNMKVYSLVASYFPNIDIRVQFAEPKNAISGSSVDLDKILFNARH